MQTDSLRWCYFFKFCLLRVQNSPANSIAAYGTDLPGTTASSSIQYGVMGSAPNRQFVIQLWTDCGQYFQPPKPLVIPDHINETTITVPRWWWALLLPVYQPAGPTIYFADAVGGEGEMLVWLETLPTFNLRSVTDRTNTWATLPVCRCCHRGFAMCHPTNFPVIWFIHTRYEYRRCFHPCHSYHRRTSICGSMPPDCSPGSHQQCSDSFCGVVAGEGTSAASMVLRGSIFRPLPVCANRRSDAKSTCRLSSPYHSGCVFYCNVRFGSTLVAGPYGTYAVSGFLQHFGRGTNYFWIAPGNIAPTLLFGDIFIRLPHAGTGTAVWVLKLPTICPAGSLKLLMKVSGPR